MQWLPKLQCFLISLKFERTFRNKLIIKFQRRLKEGDSQFLELKKKHEFLKGSDKRAYTTTNVKLTIKSVQIFSSVKFNTKTRNNWNCYLKQISVRIPLQ